jgi:hypothetical protein
MDLPAEPVCAVRSIEAPAANLVIKMNNPLTAEAGHMNLEQLKLPLEGVVFAERCLPHK